MGTGTGVKNFARGAAQLALLGASSLALMGQVAWAQENREHRDDQGRHERDNTDGPRDRRDRASDQDETITVRGARTELESPRYTAPLLETPQTITVVSAELVEQQNLLGLRDILSTLPGITFGAGEGGGGYGDSINLRGYSANSDIGVDGVRDSAQYSRTDPFNLEQVEVTNGANSVYGGAGSVGGTINLISKRARGTGDTAITGALGTDEYRRLTVDSDMSLADGAALRLNGMFHENDIAGRDVERMERWGVAPSLAFGLGSPTQVTINYLHQEDDNVPQYGVPFAINAFNDGIVSGANIERYYGWRNLDRQETQVDQATLIVDHAFNDDVSLRNLTRVQRVATDLINSNLGGTYCTDAGINPFTGVACGAPNTRTFSANGTTNFRFTENELAYNQTDITWEFGTFGWAHTLVTGVSLAHEEYGLDNGSPLYNPDGTRPAFPVQDLSDPNNFWSGPVNFIQTGATATELDNLAVYAFDAVEFNDHWELNGGVRLESYETDARTRTFSSTTGAVTASNHFVNESDLLSYRLGLVFKPMENASIYAAFGNSERPTQGSVINACNALSCNLDPEEARNYEIGAKWDVFGERLSLTAAIFRNERNAFVVENATDTAARLDGQSRVDGVALGVSGLLTDNWSVFANYTYLDSELLQDVVSAELATSFRAGDPLPNTPEHSFSLWTTYEPVRGLQLGYGATYQGEFTFSRPAAGAPLAYTDDYWVHRAMVSYAVTDHAVLQLNVNNLFDEEYYERVRNNAGNGWATPGAARSAVLSLTYEF